MTCSTPPPSPFGLNPFQLRQISNGIHNSGVVSYGGRYTLAQQDRGFIIESERLNLGSAQIDSDSHFALPQGRLGQDAARAPAPMGWNSHAEFRPEPG
jgi:hypothetical protein